MRRIAITLTFFLAGCGPRSAPVTGPVGQRLVHRHADQVCIESPAGPPAVRLAELFDTVGVAEIFPSEAQRQADGAHLDFVVRYDNRGIPVASGIWATSVDDATARRLEAQLKSRILPDPGVLGPVGFRVRVTFRPRLEWIVAAPVECLPHMAHPDGRRPEGLPESVSTWAGPMYVRDGDTTAAVVRIHVTRTGAVERVEPLRGAASAIARARQVVAGLRFDPALSNGVPVDGALVQSFRFVDPSNDG